MKTVRIVLLTLGVLHLASTVSARTRGWGLGVGVFDGDFGFNPDHAKSGLNFGCGANVMLPPRTAAFGEVKHVIGDRDGRVFTGGIYS